MGFTKPEHSLDFSAITQITNKKKKKCVSITSGYPASYSWLSASDRQAGTQIFQSTASEVQHRDLVLSCRARKKGQ